ncbi:porin family protein [Panacibacter ginsenosidivorans]|uniref:Porin family protein n=1 Tax=Panacibacter ginsenosidivorans TaxID=1813871 RepID=A0A5B8V465_9BACT|nr:outer membrane beta-barrel protein [Panacibacter ginsenosidivorans]QEC66002.1 porin family protein [Panacibacter ginsenosidivorans]
MKKIIITACSLLIMSAAFTQTQKGNVLVGADLAGFGLNFQEGNTQFSLNLNPKAGWFIKDNMLLGAEVNFGLNTQKGATATNYGVGAFARKYFGAEATNLARTTKWFVEANAGINGTNLSGDNVEKTSTNGLGVGIGPGLSYFLNQNIALEALVKYNLTVGFGSSTTNNNIGFGLGFQIYLPGKQVKQLAKDPMK